MDKREPNSDHDMEKRWFANIYFLMKVLRKLLFLEIVFNIYDRNKLLICVRIKWWGVDLINKLLRILLVVSGCDIHS